MHNYRNGIVKRSDGNQAVEELYIVTPMQGMKDCLFSYEYRRQYHVGAFYLGSGEHDEALAMVIARILHETLMIY